MMLSDTIERKFIDTIDINDWQIETDTGWSDINKIGKTIQYEKWVLKTKNYKLECADTHIVFNEKFEEIFVKDLKIGDFIQSKTGLDEVVYIENTKILENMYDFELSDDNHRFYTNDILSHNSMWLNNIATKIADQGKNVLFITLEMSDYKCIKRMGAMRLSIPIDEYDEKSKDPTYIKNKLNELKISNGGLIQNKIGKIFIKKFPTGACTLTDLDLYIDKLQTSKNVKIDAICLDYLNIMGIEKGLEFNASMLYLKGKHLAEGLRYLADKYGLVMITATQTSKDVWDANDIGLKDIPESKAVAETADTVFGIIRNPEMKKNNKYRIKVLKMRDGDFKAEQIKFDFNTKFLRMENDEYFNT